MSHADADQYPKLKRPEISRGHPSGYVLVLHGVCGNDGSPEPSLEKLLHELVDYTRRDRYKDQGIRGSNWVQRSSGGEIPRYSKPITVSRVL